MSYKTRQMLSASAGGIRWRRIRTYHGSSNKVQIDLSYEALLASLGKGTLIKPAANRSVVRDAQEQCVISYAR